MEETQEKKFVQSVQLSEKVEKKMDKNNQSSQQNKNRHYRYKKQRVSQSNQSNKPVQSNDDHIIFIHEDDNENIPRTHIYSHNNSAFPQFSQQTQTEQKDEECQSESSEGDVICCKLDKNCIVYFYQLGLITLCVSVSLYQIISGSQSNRDFFIALLSSSLGYVLPAPTLKKKNS